MNGDADVFYASVLWARPESPPGAHHFGKNTKAWIAALSEAEVLPIAVLPDVFHHLIRLSTGRVEDFDAGSPCCIAIRHDVKPMCVREAIEPVISAECADGGILNFVDTGSSSEEATDRPRGNLAGYGNLNGAALLREAVKLESRQLFPL